VTTHTVGTGEEWLAAREELLEAEQEHMRRGDELARRRQELPWVPVEKGYVFAAADRRGQCRRRRRGTWPGDPELAVADLLAGHRLRARLLACSPPLCGSNFMGSSTWARSRRR
jgi:predicted dithiol-disulfide oxidoreductase (DUF899 family)